MRTALPAAAPDEWEFPAPPTPAETTAAHDRLETLSPHVARLERDPAILTQPAGYLDDARAAWTADRTTDQATTQARIIAAQAEAPNRADRDSIYRPASEPPPSPPDRGRSVSR